MPVQRSLRSSRATRRPPSGATSGALVLAAVALACGAPEAVAPNLLLVSIDTLRADHSSAYGYARETTPNLERLAEQGARFEVAYAPTSTTGPTHATLFTALYPRVHAVRKNGLTLADRHVTLAEALRDSGHTTAAIVGSFALHRKFGFAQGFDRYSDDFRYSTATLRVERWEDHDVPEGFDRPATEVTDLALDWLDARDPAAPFFLFVHYFDPHFPYVPPEPYRSRFERANLPSGRPAMFLRDIDLYDAEIAYTDQELGRLLEGLAERDLEDATLVVVTADHGQGLGQHGVRYHDVQIYEEAVRVPLVVRWPGRVASGLVIDAPVALIELRPMLLELVGATQGSDPVGSRLAAALRGGGELDPTHPVFLERRRFDDPPNVERRVRGEKVGVRMGPWKYLEAPAEGTRELFHLERDPSELSNVAELEPERASELADRLARWRRENPQARVEDVPERDLERLRVLGYTD